MKLAKILTVGLISFSTIFSTHKSTNALSVEFANSAESVGLDSAKLAQLESNIQEQINLGYPSFTVLVMRQGKIGYLNSFGYKQIYNEKQKLNVPINSTKDTIYDLASNTKMYATNFALQKLVTEGKLSLNELVSTYYPGFKDSPSDLIKGKDTLKVINLLHHNAGFPADPQYHNNNFTQNLYSQNKATTIQKIIETPLDYIPGTKNVYSDVDYLILGLIIENITGQSLDTYVENEIFKPLGLTKTKFNPLQKGLNVDQFAATEIYGNTRQGVVDFNNIRKTTIRGEVHDEKTYYSMNGVSGSAGLFSNAEELAVLVQLMANKGTYKGVTIFSEEVANTFLTPNPNDNTYGLGWRLNSENKMPITFGENSSPQTYGHTGWTGTLTLIDPTNDLQIILLGNRPHSPIIEPDVTPNKFVSSTLDISKYNWTINQIYDALLPLNNSSNQDNQSENNNQTTDQNNQIVQTNSNSDNLNSTNNSTFESAGSYNELLTAISLVFIYLTHKIIRKN